MNIKQLAAKWDTRSEKTENVNFAFSSVGIKEHFKSSRTPLLHVEPNRKARRLHEFADPNGGKAVQNNRAKTKARINNKLFNKMSYFHLQVTNRIGMAKYGIAQ